MLRFVAPLLLAGCAGLQPPPNDAFRAYVSDLAHRSAAINIARFCESRTAIPEQVTVSSGSSGISIGAEARAAPQIDFRGIALTGVGVGGTYGASQDMQVAPVTNALDLRRLQMFYRHLLDRQSPSSVCARSDPSVSFLALEQASWRLESPGEARTPPASRLLSAVLGPFPEGPLIEIRRGGSCPPDSESTDVRELRICFLPASRQPDGGPPSRTGRETRDIITLWTISIPQYDADRTPLTPPARPGRPNPGAPAMVPQPQGGIIRRDAPPVVIVPQSPAGRFLLR